MTRCRMAGAPCPNEAVALVRVTGLGDRPLCQECIDFLTRVGAWFRILSQTGGGDLLPAPAGRNSRLPVDRRFWTWAR